MGTSFAERRKQAEAAGLLSSGDYLKLKEGDNRVRLMTECVPHQSEYQGRKNFKWLCYVLDRADARIKPFFMPHTIYKQIEALQTSEDYDFADVPMPYDITIHAAGAGTKEVKYTLMPARKNTPVTAMEHQQLASMKSLDELHKALKDKQKQTPAPPSDEDNTPLPDDDPEYPFYTK